MKKFFYVLFPSLFLISCYKVPFTNRYQIRLIPDELVNTLSLDVYQSLLNEHKVLPNTDERHKQVYDVGINIINAANELFKNTKHSFRIKNFNWDFKVLESDVVNAFCLPGGKIVFYSGIFPVAKDEDGIACVMGHEVAHAIARHSSERLSQLLLVYIGESSLQIALSNKPKETKELFKALYGISSTFGILAYSRKHEYEADKLGLILMAKAGYDPNKAIEFWERMNSLNKNQKIPEWLSTHPSDENRIKELKKFLPTALKYYEKNK